MIIMYDSVLAPKYAKVMQVDSATSSDGKITRQWFHLETYHPEKRQIVRLKLPELGKFKVYKPVANEEGSLQKKSRPTELAFSLNNEFIVKCVMRNQYVVRDRNGNLLCYMKLTEDDRDTIKLTAYADVESERRIGRANFYYWSDDHDCIVHEIQILKQEYKKTGLSMFFFRFIQYLITTHKCRMCLPKQYEMTFTIGPIEEWSDQWYDFKKEYLESFGVEHPDLKMLSKENVTLDLSEASIARAFDVSCKKCDAYEFMMRNKNTKEYLQRYLQIAMNTFSGKMCRILFGQTIYKVEYEFDWEHLRFFTRVPSHVEGEEGVAHKS